MNQWASPPLFDATVSRDAEGLCKRQHEIGKTMNRQNALFQSHPPEKINLEHRQRVMRVSRWLDAPANLQYCHSGVPLSVRWQPFRCGDNKSD